ncbi:G patch domain-containing protein 11-like [Symsagittifera roscoffensis]|uniref:G patch domain-containing protein 11-like n=1 Tax=Symsagittifera roscoffensis TaxID=84072 RepID=UPI00307BFC70
MSSDEEDYMSTDFLEKLEQSDIRPGLVFSSKTARQKELQKRKLEADSSNNTKKTRPSLKESLATPIDKNNKGFALLSKMGFKEGSGLGKSGDGIKDPVPISMKVDRSGLGTETVRNEKKKKAEKMIEEVRSMRDRAMSMQRDQFRSEKQSQFYERRLFGVLRNNQRVCFKLDSEKGLTWPVDIFFWPPSEMKSDDSEDEGAAEEIEEETNIKRGISEPESDGDEYLVSSGKVPEMGEDKTLKVLTSQEMTYQLGQLESYLRKTYFYCIWCSSLYKDEEELDCACPGEGPAAHGENLAPS